MCPCPTRHACSADLTGYGPFADPDIQHAIKAHVKLVYGECFWVGFAPQPAEVPTECGRGLPDACPERLWGKHLTANE